MKADARVKRIDEDEDAPRGDPARAGRPDYGPGGLRRGRRLTPVEIAVRYVGFAIVATICNLAAQRLVLAALRQEETVAFGWAPDLLDWVLGDLLGVVSSGQLGWRAEWRGPLALTLAIGLGTAVGLVVKYLLDKRWIFFVDAAGVARVVAPLFSVEGGFDPRLDHWLTVFRDHGRPERDLPEVQRFSEEDEEGELPGGEDEED